MIQLLFNGEIDKTDEKMVIQEDRIEFIKEESEGS